MDQPDIGAYYDQFWSGADPAALAAHDYRAFQADLFAYVDQLLGPLAGRRVLEIGPGLGHDTLRLAQRGAEVWAIDLSQRSLEIVAARCAAAGVGDRVHLVRMNGERLGFPDASFDLTYVQNTLVHADWPRVVHECARVLRPGGRALFIEPLRDHPAVALYRATLSRCRSSRPRYLRWGDFERLRRAFRESQLQPFYLTAVLALPLRRTPLDRLIRPPLQALDRHLLRLPWLRPFAWYIVACYTR